MANVKVRSGTKADANEIVRLIKEMADYERMADQVKMTTYQLQEDISKGYFEAIVAEDRPGRLVAYCVYYYSYSTFRGRSIYLEDIYVSGSSRNQGVGKKLLQKLAQVGLQKKCERIDFVVLNWNSPSIMFYKRFGAENITDKEQWNLYRLDQSKMNALARS
ncbi:hypothetical protein CAPTEDRAFT_21951 [Capitella teleta]|uniref:N-acetyltransferase domain-containing protein n=1 Tax=Capitella teleta TaxID=283909 RepID=X2APN7_CAPTE|nr:hypothetical protein CAPTEDRAFT_21951 [Capitella teleta]|eukprot:ELU00249.1 hypothetical protein CAPTEDRAFT_21951 [Capitella teleta]